MTPQAIFTPREIARTGDDRPAGSVWGYIRRMTGRAQVGAFVLALGVTLLGMAPIELQRRMVDDAISDADFTLLAFLTVVYLLVVFGHQTAKFALRTLQAWMGESAILYTRSHLWKLHRGDEAVDEGKDVVAIVTREVEALGRFAGGAPSQAFANASLLIGTLAYMIWVSPVVAAAGLALLAPQAILTPLMQRRLNRLVEVRVRLLRRLTAAIGASDPPDERHFAAMTRRVFRIRLAFDVWKYLMKGVLNLMNSAAPLAVIAVGGWLVIEGDATLGVVLAFVTGFSRLGDPIRQLIAFYREAAEAEVRHRLIARWMTA